MNTASYSQEYVPSAPVIPLRIAIPGATLVREEFTALVDTGADGTFIPTAILEKLELPILYMTNVRSHLGERLHRVPVHKIDIALFGSVLLPNIEVVGDDWGSEIILGRNVLNKLKLHLDGPSEIASVSE